MENFIEKILAAEGKIKADLVLKRCRILNVNTKEIQGADIAVKSGYIVGIGDVCELEDGHTRVIEVNNRYVSPGLIDGHVHFESSMVTLSEFSAKALEHGTTGIVIDPHEIANVLGRQGIELVLKEAKTLPLNVFVTVPSCVPATVFETSGAALELVDIESLMGIDFVVGLGEMMDYQDVLDGDTGKIAMIKAAMDRKKAVDGHCPGLSGRDLWGYMCAGVSSDHESITYEEAWEKLRAGMKLMLREGSAATSLASFLPGLIEAGISLENVFFVTDDRHPADLIRGYMDVIVRKAIRLGLDPLDAVSLCTINTARHYRVDQLVGSISIGRRADLVILDDLENFRINSVYAGGRSAAAQVPSFQYPGYVFDTVKYREMAPGDIQITSSRNKTISVKAIKVFPDRIFTEMVPSDLRTDSRGVLRPDPDTDVMSAAVIERHGKNGNIGLGFVRGFNLECGAFAQSIGHDSHNVIVIGADHRDMTLAANALRTMRGGIVIAQEGQILDSLPLPFAGLLSIRTVEEVESKLTELHGIMKDMGCKLPAPFITNSFLALPVIPDIRLTDMGLFDVKKFELVDVLV